MEGEGRVSTHVLGRPPGAVLPGGKAAVSPAGEEGA